MWRCCGYLTTLAGVKPSCLIHCHCTCVLENGNNAGTFYIGLHYRNIQLKLVAIIDAVVIMIMDKHAFFKLG